MRKQFTLSAVALLIGLMAATSAGARDDFPFKKQITARKAFMQVFAYNLGLLGGMAKGEMPYDAKIASAAANNLLAAAMMDNSTMWPAGSDADAPGLYKKTRAKADIWADFPRVSSKHKDLTDALKVMAAEAGNGLAAVRANMKAVGKGCKGCHKPFRVPKDKK